MKKLKHWFVCLDLSKMDEALINYVKFLSDQLDPSTISFLHIVESESISNDMMTLFPELKSQQDFDEIIRDELTDKVTAVFQDQDFETRVIIKQGRPTDEIIKVIRTMDPDLLVMGKKTGYKGKGMLAQKIVKYVPSSILLVPETSRYSLQNILVPVDFSKQAANAVRAATRLSLDTGCSIFAQHVFRYPAHFFPYIPSEKEEEKIRTHLNEKAKKFIKEYEISDEVTFINTVLKQGEKAAEVYNETVRNQADMILMATKGNKTLSSLLRDDFSDKIINYSFGIPLFILKNKETHQKYLDAFAN